MSGALCFLQKLLESLAQSVGSIEETMGVQKCTEACFSKQTEV